jgi:type II secretory pathway predicted ATPase ExeA
MSEEIQRNLNIESTIKDGRVAIVFSQYLDDDPMDEFDMIGLLTASLSMALKVTMNKLSHKDQGELMEEVIQQLEESFADYKSFQNVKKFERPDKDE